MEQSALVWGVLAPGLIVGVGALLATRSSEQGSGFSCGSLLLALGFACGCVGLFGIPPLPSSSRTLSAIDVLTWMTAIGGLLLFVDGRFGAKANLVRLIFAATTLALVLRSAAKLQWEGAEVALWSAGLAVLALALWFSFRALAARAQGASIPAVLLVLLTGVAVCSALTGSAKIGQLVGLLCAGVGALWIVSWMRSSLRLGGGELTLILTVGFGFALCALFYSELPAQEAALLASASFAPWLAELPVFRARRERTRACVRVVFALVFVGAAVTRAALAFEPDPYAEYGY